MFEQIFKALKTKYNDLGLGDVFLKVIAKRLAKTVKEESEIEQAVTDLEDEMKFQQSQNDTLRTLRTQLKTLEEGAKKKEEPTPAPPKEEPKNDDVPKWAEALINSSKTLEEKLQALEQEKIQVSNKSKLISKLKELGVSEHFYSSQIDGRVFKDEEEINAFAQGLKNNEDAYLQAINYNKLKDVDPPKNGGEAGEQVSAEVQAFINSKLKQ